LNASFSLVYYTDMTVIYPVYFSESWVRDRLNSAQGQNAGTTDFNPLRARRFADTVGGRTQEELYALLAQKLLGYAQAGRTVALIASTDDPAWYTYLDRGFTHEVIARDERVPLVMFRLRPR
jgi:hypothetical protein